MDGTRGAHIWTIIHVLAREEHETVSIRHTVQVCARVLSAGGAGLAMMREDGEAEPLYAIGPGTEALEEMQYALGEGPGAEVAGSGVPVLAADLRTDRAARRWPRFSREAARQGTAAAFAFPVGAGAALLGVLSAYRSTPGGLGGDALADALTCADAAFVLALDERGGINSDLWDLIEAAFAERRGEVHQAAGMVTAQLGVDLTAAFVVLRNHAYTHGRRLSDVAADVTAGRLRFGPARHDAAGTDRGAGGRPADGGREIP